VLEGNGQAWPDNSFAVLPRLSVTGEPVRACCLRTSTACNAVLRYDMHGSPGV
jgi:hypothetical protein